ncbi:MAG TPA: pyridoxamine 5'-phosphate oxidase family protein, partial [Symbiobacteriaceae bacterium]|nr:pyridoxamine 5'-phosphate oxidase family protein [Symbiobacteriaceae bacterium]
VKAVLARESSAALVTSGPEGPHLVATWNSYIEILAADALAFPAGGMRQTQANVEAGSPVQLIIGSRDDAGKGTGFLLLGQAEFQSDTPVHERLKRRFPWCRAAVVMHINRAEKVLG